MPASSSPRRVYLDANTLLAYVGKEVGRAHVIRALLEEGHRGIVEVITSVLSITEVAYGALERDDGLTAEGEQLIDKLWEPASPIVLVDISESVTREARTIIRDAKTRSMAGVRSADALHLATARLHRADAFFTYERQETRARWAELTGMDVVEPVTNTPQLDV